MNTRFLALLLLSTAASCLQQASAQEVGVIGAVNPTSQSTAPGRTIRSVELGQQVIFREKISTTSAGSVQLAFIDKSTLTIGANSNVVIDEYVFNPATDTGKMTVSVGKGVMRFVGGQLSHSGNAQIRTPTATIGLRGAAGSVTVGPNGATTYNHHFGRATVRTDAGTQIVSRPGFSVTVASTDTPPSSPSRTPQSNIDQVTVATLSKPAEAGGSTTRPSDTQAQSRLGTTQIGVDPRRTAPVQSSTAGSPTSTASEVNTLARGNETLLTVQNATNIGAVAPIAARVAAPRAFTLMTPSSTGALPYLSATFVGPHNGSTVFTPILAYRAGGSGTNNDRSSAMQVSLAINGQGRNQTAQMVVATGTLNQRQAGGEFVFSGGFFGSTRNGATQNTGHTRGAMTSVPGGVTLDQDQLPTSVQFDQNQINRSTGERYASSARVSGSIVPTGVEYTYNTTATRGDTPAGLGENRPATTLSGFAGGILQYSRWADDSENAALVSRGYAPIRTATNGPSDVLITLDPTTSKASANIRIVQTGSFTNLRSATYEFGGTESSSRARSAYIDINNFALRGRVSEVDPAQDTTRSTSTYTTTTGSGTYGGSTATGSTGTDLALLTWNSIAQQDPTAAGRFFPGTNLCACEYTQWGFWSANMNRYTGVGTQIEGERGNLLLWVAGQLASPSSIPSAGSATYNGHAVANIYDNVTGTRYQYIAAGNFSNTVNFGTRTSNLSISNLDGLTYLGATTINPTNGTFQGTISSGPAGAYGTVSGPLVGAFYGSGTTVPQEVAGQFNALSSVTNASGNVYFAGGIFLGKR